MFDFICGVIIIFVILYNVVEYGIGIRSICKKTKKTKTPKRPIFKDEEILALGLYPKDEGYKMHLISKILNKR